jgi:hypothetical protein
MLGEKPIPGGVEVCASKTGYCRFHAIHDRSCEVDEFVVEPVVEGRCIVVGGRFRRSGEVLGVSLRWFPPIVQKRGMQLRDGWITNVTRFRVLNTYLQQEFGAVSAVVAGECLQ